MSSLPSLLKKLREVTEQIASLQVERNIIERQIIVDRRRAKPRKPRKKLIEDRIGAPTRELVKAMHDYGEPTGRTELGELLSITPAAAAKRLERALELALVEKAGYGLYKLTAAAEAALK